MVGIERDSTDDISHGDADEQGVPEVYLGVNKDNSRAIALYESLGWTIIAEIESNCPQGSWRMVRARG